MRRSVLCIIMRETENFVNLYFRTGFTNRKILHLLAHQHHIIISFRTLRRIYKNLSLFGRKNDTCLEEIGSFVEAKKPRTAAVSDGGCPRTCLFIST